LEDHILKGKAERKNMAGEGRFYDGRNLYMEVRKFETLKPHESRGDVSEKAILPLLRFIDKSIGSWESFKKKYYTYNENTRRFELPWIRFKAVYFSQSEQHSDDFDLQLLKINFQGRECWFCQIRGFHKKYKNEELVGELIKFETHVRWIGILVSPNRFIHVSLDVDINQINEIANFDGFVMGLNSDDRDFGAGMTVLSENVYKQGIVDSFYWYHSIVKDHVVSSKVHDKGKTINQIPIEKFGSFANRHFTILNRYSDLNKRAKSNEFIVTKLNFDDKLKGSLTNGKEPKKTFSVNISIPWNSDEYIAFYVLNEKNIPVRIVWISASSLAEELDVTMGQFVYIYDKKKEVCTSNFAMVPHEYKGDMIITGEKIQSLNSDPMKKLYSILVKAT
jgi:hypothetical protein